MLIFAASSIGGFAVARHGYRCHCLNTSARNGAAKYARDRAGQQGSDHEHRKPPAMAAQQAHELKLKPSEHNVNSVTVWLVESRVLRAGFAPPSIRTMIRSDSTSVRAGKTERTARQVYRTRNAARADVFDYIERFYNLRRRHSTLGYISPVDYEAKMRLA
jgi:Integrase core domain